MSSDNPSGADNQQERPSTATWLDEVPHDLGHYIAGFVDGEGSFNVPIRRSDDRGLPFRVSLSFNVSQVGPEAPSLLKSVFGAGTTRARGDGVWYFEVTKPAELESKGLPVLRSLPAPALRSPVTWRSSVRSPRWSSRATFDVDGFIEILALRAPMNRGGKRRRTDDELIEALRRWESSEAIRKAPLSKREEEDMVHAP